VGGGGGAAGGGGGGGAGGTIELVGSTFSNNNGEAFINTSGGNDSENNSAGNGRLITGNNTATSLNSNVQGATILETTGPSRANPFVSGTPQVPFIPELPGGAEAFGLTGLSAVAEIGLGGSGQNGPSYLIDFPSIIANAPQGAAAALLEEQLGSTPFGNNFPGYEFILYINLTNQNLAAPQLGVGQAGFFHDLVQEGYQNDPLFGGDGPVTLSQLGPYQIYTTLVPNGSIDYNVAFSRNGTDYSGSTNGLTEGVPFYVDSSVSPTNILSGQLNPASDTGQSNRDGITRDYQPNFFGSSNPFSSVILYATPSGGGPLMTLGATEANGSGSWSMNTTLIPDGSYTITAAAVDINGLETAATQIMPNADQGPLVIDTVAPVITNLVFKRNSGKIVVTYQDDRSGMSLSTIGNSNNDSLTKAHTRPGTYLVTGVSTASDGVPSDPITVTLTINKGKRLPAGQYLFVVVGDVPSGVADVAGNLLDGAFYGNFPSGNGQAGVDFIARLNSTSQGWNLHPAPVRGKVSSLSVSSSTNESALPTDPTARHAFVQTTNAPLGPRGTRLLAARLHQHLRPAHFRRRWAETAMRMAEARSTG
jgi:hypothetical protein